MFLQYEQLLNVPYDTAVKSKVAQRHEGVWGVDGCIYGSTALCWAFGTYTVSWS
jgi:hypothetical protein